MMQDKTSNTLSSYPKAKAKVIAIRHFYHHLLVYIIINLLTALGVHYFQASFSVFLLTSVMIWGIGLFIHAWNVFNWNPFLNKKWEERKLKEILDDQPTKK